MVAYFNNNNANYKKTGKNARIKFTADYTD